MDTFEPVFGLALFSNKNGEFASFSIEQKAKNLCRLDLYNAAGRYRLRAADKFMAQKKIGTKVPCNAMQEYGNGYSLVSSTLCNCSAVRLLMVHIRVRSEFLASRWSMFPPAKEIVWCGGNLQLVT